MKKSELNELINRKKILQESLEIIKESSMGMDEIGGYDSPDLLSHYHGNYLDELNKVFSQFDNLVDPFANAIYKTIKDDEINMSKEILTKFLDFMESYLKYLRYLYSKNVEIKKKYPNPMKPNLGKFDPTLGDINLNEDI